jgi:hypothetical protein
MDDARSNGFASRLRRTVLRVPALISRATRRRARDACRADLLTALGCLEEVERQLRVCQALIDSAPGEMDRLRDRLGSSRDSIRRIVRRIGSVPGAEPGAGEASVGVGGRPGAGFEAGGSG